MIGFIRELRLNALNFFANELELGWYYKISKLIRWIGESGNLKCIDEANDKTFVEEVIDV